MKFVHNLYSAVISLQIFVLWTVSGLAVLHLILRTCYKLLIRRVPAELSMQGKTVIVTGAETGIGKETVRELALRGSRIIMACWDMQRGALTREEIVSATGNTEVYTLHLDLGSLSSVREFAKEVTRREKQVNNAGALNLPAVTTKDGLLYEMQVNYFGHFLLTLLLSGLLRQSGASRVVSVSSIEHWRGDIDVSLINCPRQKIYANSKLATVLFSNELARRLQGTGVTCNSLDPGIAPTKITRNYPWRMHSIVKPFVRFIFMEVNDAAQCSVYLAVSPDVEKTSGKYFWNCKECKPSKKALDQLLARRLWEESVKLVGVHQSEVDFNIM